MTNHELLDRRIEEIKAQYAKLCVKLELDEHNHEEGFDLIIEKAHLIGELTAYNWIYKHLEL